MLKGLNEPHILLASSNPYKLMRNLQGILTARQILKIQKEVDKNVVGLYSLALSHYNFAIRINNRDWRQRASRFYYAAYNLKRALQLKESGNYATDASDHKTVDELPDRLNNVAMYRAKLKTMRDDRNLADYSHSAKEDDLLLSTTEIQDVVTNLISDTQAYFVERNVRI